MIELRQLSARYGDREVLHALEGQIGGRAVGLLGPNGAGKSTLIAVLLGFLSPSAGGARVLGLEVGPATLAIRQRVGYMPENDAFLADMTAVAFVRLMAELSGLPPDAALERAHEALFYVGLGEARYRRLGSYSVGMRQLAKLAQAIVHGPELLILDEPTNSLDPPARARMLELIRQMRDSGAMQILLCSHLLADVEETCEQVVILNRGRIVQRTDLAGERQAQRRYLELQAGLGGGGEARDATARLAERLQRLGCEVSAGAAGRLWVTLAGNVAVRDVYRCAAELALPLRRLEFRRDTLEDIFLRAVGAEPAAPEAVAEGVAEN